MHYPSGVSKWIGAILAAKRKTIDTAEFPRSVKLRSLLEAKGLHNPVLAEHGRTHFGAVAHPATYGRVINGWRQPILEAVIADALGFPFEDIGGTEPEDSLLAPVWRAIYRRSAAGESLRTMFAPLKANEKKRIG